MAGLVPAIHVVVPRGEHVIVARTRVVGMAVRDHGARGGGVRVDIEAAGPAKKPATVDRQPGVELFGSHFFSRCVEQITVFGARAVRFYSRLECIKLHAI
jgi:hypothetical protein